MGLAYNLPRAGTIPYLKIDFSGSGDNTLKSLVALNRINVHRIWLVVGGATNLTFKDGATALTGAVPMSSNGGLTFDLSGEPWFVTTIGNAFIVGSSNAVQVSGGLWYTLTT